MTVTRWTQIKALSLAIGFASACPAQAAKPGVDYFSAGTHSSKAKAPPAQMPTGAFPADANPEDKAVKWFEKLDETIFAHKATAADRVILSRPFNQEAERVQQWTDKAAQVAKQYRQLAKTLKAMPVPDNMPGVKDYRDLTADWYDDVAAIYEDLIRPRAPARTMEELDALLDEIKARSQALAETNKNLKAMDVSLRKTYRVHLARYDDALQQYVRSKTN